MSMTNPTRHPIDHVVDDDYLAACDRAWAVVQDHARSILADIDASAYEAPDEHRAYCVRWLRRALTIPTGGGPAGMADEAAPTLDLLAHAAAEYPAFLRGETSGPAILLAGEGLRLWYDYFGSGNGLYRPLNAAAADTVIARLRDRDGGRGGGGGGARLLEVGAGTGGATGHLLAAWPDDLADVEYTVSDTSPRLLRETRERLADRAPDRVRLDFRRFDFDLPPDRQRVEPASFDVVVAVNAIHNAADLGTSLRSLRSLLRPGGALVLSESICGPGEQVHQELVLNLLPLPADAYGRLSRFHSRADWLGILAAAGVRAEVLANSSGPELVMTAVVTTA